MYRVHFYPVVRWNDSYIVISLLEMICAIIFMHISSVDAVVEGFTSICASKLVVGANDGTFNEIVITCSAPDGIGQDRPWSEHMFGCSIGNGNFTPPMNAWRTIIPFETSAVVFILKLPWYVLPLRNVQGSGLFPSQSKFNSVTLMFVDPQSWNGTTMALAKTFMTQRMKNVRHKRGILGNRLKHFLNAWRNHDSTITIYFGCCALSWNDLIKWYRIFSMTLTSSAGDHATY